MQVEEEPNYHYLKCELAWTLYYRKDKTALGKDSSQMQQQEQP